MTMQITALALVIGDAMTGIEFEFASNSQHEGSFDLKMESDCQNWQMPDLMLLRYLQQLVRLNAQLPLRIVLNLFNCQPRVTCSLEPIHRLQQEMLKVQLFIVGQHLCLLRNDDFKLITFDDLQFGAHLGTHANPVDTGRNRNRAIGLDGNLKADRMHAGNQSLIQLQQRFTAGKHHIFTGCIRSRPQAVDRLRHLIAGLELTAALTVGADKVSIAKLANRRAAVFFASAPEIATRKATKHRRTTGMRALALQGIENFFNAVSHNEA